MNTKKDGGYVKIDFVKIVEGIIYRLWLVILSMLVCGCILFSYATFWVTPLYQASTLMYVNNSSFSVGATSFSISSSEINAAKSLVDTYLVILNTRSTLNDVIRQGELDCTYGELRGMISAGSVNDTEVFSVTVTSPDPQMAEHIANTIAQVLPGKIADVVEGSSVRIVDYAVVPSGKVFPSIRNYTIFGLLGGLILSCGLIAIMEIMDDQIHSENYLLESYGDIPLLSVVPDLLEERGRKSYYYYKRGYYRSNYYRQNYYKEENDRNSSAGKRRKSK